MICSSVNRFLFIVRLLLKGRTLNLRGGNLQWQVKDDKKQHRLRRTVCKSWRNKQWYGRMLAFLELLSGETAFVPLPLGANAHIKLDAAPLLFTSPVSTPLPDKLGDDQEEEDTSTLGRPEPEEEL